MTEDEEMRKYAEAHGCGELRLTDEQLKKLKDMIEREPAYIHIEMDSPVRPLPCVRDKHGDMFCRPLKEFVLKIYEELSEVQEAVYEYGYLLCTGTNLPEELEKQPRAKYLKMRIAEEAADTITAITTMLEALGIDAGMRDEAQRRVNENNRNRGRL